LFWVKKYFGKRRNKKKTKIFFQVKKFGPIFGFYFGSTPAVILADHNLIKEAFKHDSLAARPDLSGGKIHLLQEI
jgi:hypothetical protein